MSLAVSGTGTSFVVTPSTQVNPFKTASILDSTNTLANKATVVITVTDINGGPPTDADGVFTRFPYYFSHTAPGVYTLTDGVNDMTSDLRALPFNSPATAGTALFKLNVTDSLNQATADSQTSVVSVVPPTKFIVSDQTTGLTRVVNGTPYAGAVAGLLNQYIAQGDNAIISANNLNITAVTPNSFIHSGGGTDAIDVSGAGGKNVLDGGTGSNFLVGGKLGNGTDTFFVDDRGPTADVYSTVVNFHAGDDATIFGVNPTDFAANIYDNQGAPGFTGVDFAFSASGHANVNFVLAGYTTADIASGRLSLTYGTTADQPGLPGSQFLLIHGN